MFRLPRFLIFFWSFALWAQNPHGDDFRINCADCHNSGSWQVDYATINFDHSKQTGFELEGRHAEVNCMDCHQQLNFKGLEANCVSCHTDVHEMTVGDDCVRCHNSDSWLVFAIPEMHEQNGFPLMGAHVTLACVDCHKSDNNLAWQRIGNECIDCHREDYTATQNPNHLSSGFGTDCIQCHEPMSRDWGGDNFHYFFPLTGGHDMLECMDCHQSTSYNQIEAVCASCHIEDYNNASQPNHISSGFPVECTLCHNTNPGWSPASFRSHDDNYFPIYSGRHAGVWNSCAECHLNPSNFSSFSCIDCHEHSNENEMRDEHDDVGGFRFESTACYNCHPRGEE